MEKYQIIYADPPWSYKVWPEDKKQAQGCAKKYYDTMSIEDICKINIKSIADKDCKLFLWVTPPVLEEAFRVINAWGFEYKTIAFTWIKTNKRYNLDQYSFLPENSISYFYGIGHWTASNSELCLGCLIKNGKLNRQAKDISQVVLSPITKHSQKPKQIRDKIVRLCGDLPRIELFAREKTPGWTSIGNDIDGIDIKESLDKLIAQ